MREWEPVNVIIFSSNKQGEPRLYHGSIPSRTRMDIINCPPGLHITIPILLEELGDNAEVPIYNIVENLRREHWDMFRNMN